MIWFSACLDDNTVANVSKFGYLLLMPHRRRPVAMHKKLCFSQITQVIESQKNKFQWLKFLALSESV